MLTPDQDHAKTGLLKKHRKSYSNNAVKIEKSFESIESVYV